MGTQGFEHHQSYILDNLMPDSMYEAQIQAKNNFGWSQVSEKFQFYTRAYGKCKNVLKLVKTLSNRLKTRSRKVMNS